MTELTAKRCIPCEGGVAPMSADGATAMLGQLKDWKLDEAGKEISRGFEFKNYYQTMAFVVVGERLYLRGEDRRFAVRSTLHSILCRSPMA